MTPAKTPTVRPSLRLNSLTLAFLASAESSFSLEMPAIPAKTIPAAQTATPISVTMPERCVSSWPNWWWKMGGMRVPKTAQLPMQRAMPSDMPR